MYHIKSNAYALLLFKLEKCAKNTYQKIYTTTVLNKNFKFLKRMITSTSLESNQAA